MSQKTPNAPTKDWWKIIMGSSGVLPLVFVVLGTGGTVGGFIYGINKGKDITEDLWRNRFSAEVGRWNDLIEQASKTGERQLSLAKQELNLQHSEELSKANSAIKSLRHELASVTAAQKLQMSVGASPVDQFILTEQGGLSYAADLSKVNQWEFIIQDLEKSGWRALGNFSCNQAWQFMEKETIDFGPSDDDPEAGKATRQRILWGYSNENDWGVSVVGVIRAERSLIVEIAKEVAESQGEKEKLPENLTRLPVGVFSGLVAIGALGSDDRVLDSIPEFTATRDAFHIVTHLKGKGRVTRGEFLVIEKKGMVYGVFGITSATNALDPNIGVARKWVAESRLVLDLN